MKQENHNKGLFYHPSPRQLRGGSLIDDSGVNYGRDTSTKNLKASSDFAEQYKTALSDIDMEMPTLKSGSKKDRDLYRNQMAIYNKKVKDKEKGFKQQYKSEIMGNLDDQFLQAGYTKDKSGKWRKPASLSSVPWMEKAIGWIPGATDFANRAITAGEKLYNKPNLENIMNAGQTLVDSGMAGYNMGKQLADPKKLIKDIAIQQGKKALGMGLPKDYNKIDNHYNGHKKRKMKGKGLEEEETVVRTRPNISIIEEDNEEVLNALLANEPKKEKEYINYNPEIWAGENNTNEAIEERKKILEKVDIDGNYYEQLRVNSNNAISDDSISVNFGISEATNNNIKIKPFQNIKLEITDSNDKDIIEKTKKYFPIDNINISIINKDNNTIEIETKLEEDKQYSRSMGDISDCYVFEANTKGQPIKKELVISKKERDEFEKEMREAGINEKVIKDTLTTKASLQTNKFKGNSNGFLKYENGMWKLKRNGIDEKGNPITKPVNVILNDKKKSKIPIDKISEYNLITLNRSGKVEKRDMYDLAQKICEKDKYGFFDVKPERLITELEPKKGDFKDKTGKVNVKVYEKSLSLYKRKYAFWLNNEYKGKNACFINEDD